MDVKLVQTLLSQQTALGASYNGQPVWIKSVNESNLIALISTPVFGEPDKEIPINQLHEL